MIVAHLFLFVIIEFSIKFVSLLAEILKAITIILRIRNL